VGWTAARLMAERAGQQLPVHLPRSLWILSEARRAKLGGRERAEMQLPLSECSSFYLSCSLTCLNSKRTSRARTSALLTWQQISHRSACFSLTWPTALTIPLDQAAPQSALSEHFEGSQLIVCSSPTEWDDVC